jgi:dTDP-4-dehydrorhamnose reductase
MKVLIIGKTGQLARELVDSAPLRLQESDVQLVVMGRPELDIANRTSSNPTIMDISPDVIINASAYTAVDKAESEVDEAYAINDLGVGHLAEACAANSIRLLHVSTDFVFGNDSAVGPLGIAPLLPHSRVNPLSIYGASKLAGENHIQRLLADQSVIVRTAWVYSSYGNNFVKTMLRLMASKPEIGVIADQIGTPTWAKGLAQWLWAVVDKPGVSGLFHWTDAGAASWYDFAVAIQELALEKGLLDHEIIIKPLPTSGYPTPAKRPSYSILDKTSAEHVAQISAVHWRRQLNAMLDELKNKTTP